MNTADNTDEIIGIVDKDGNILKYVKRGTLQDNQTWRNVCIWVENDKNQVLMQQRQHHKIVNPGLWTCAVEGTITEDEPALDTAIREMEEEIGLTSVKLVPTKKLHYKASHGWRLSQGYKAICNWPVEKFTPQPEEVAQVQWFDRSELIAKLKAGDAMFPPSGKIWLEMFDLL